MVDSPAAAFDFDRIDRRTRKVTPTLISAIVQRVVNHVHPRSVILFGSQAQSQAKGGRTQESDVDLFILLDDRHPLAQLPRRERSHHLLELFRYRSFGLDVIVLTQSEVQHLQDTNEGEWDLTLEILNHGKVLYERHDLIET